MQAFYCANSVRPCLGEALTLKESNDIEVSMKNKKIRTNKIKCLKCGDIIESTSAHDFKFCSCGACAVDGGMEYLRRVGEREDWEELSEFDETECQH